MKPSDQKFPLVISISLFLAFIALMLLYPSATSTIGNTFLLVSFGMASLIVVKRNRNAYLQGQITRTVFIRNTSIEIIGILLAMALAGLLGRYLSQVVTLQISHTFIRIMAGLLIGLLVGVGAGLLVKRTWGRLVKTEGSA